MVSKTRVLYIMFNTNFPNLHFVYIILQLLWDGRCSMYKMICIVSILVFLSSCSNGESYSIIHSQAEDLRDSMVNEQIVPNNLLMYYKLERSEGDRIQLQFIVENKSTADIKDFSFIALIPNELEEQLSDSTTLLENVKTPTTIVNGETLIVKKELFFKKKLNDEELEELLKPMKLRYYWGDNGQLKKIDTYVKQQTMS